MGRREPWLLSVLCVAVACAPARSPTASTPGRSAPVQSFDYGAYPANFQQIVSQHFASTLKDPYSAQYRFGQPYRAVERTGLLFGGGVIWAGYAVTVEVNAKNSYGAYTGYKPYLVQIKYGQVVDVDPGTYHPLISATAVGLGARGQDL